MTTLKRFGFFLSLGGSPKVLSRFQSHDTILLEGLRRKSLYNRPSFCPWVFFRNWATLLLGSIEECSLLSLACSDAAFLFFSLTNVRYHDVRLAIIPIIWLFRTLCVFLFSCVLVQMLRWSEWLAASSFYGSYILSVEHLLLPVASSQSHGTLSGSHANTIPTATFHTNSSRLLLHSSPTAPVASRIAVAQTSTASALLNSTAP
jgi:hypothetical protein